MVTIIAKQKYAFDVLDGFIFSCPKIEQLAQGELVAVVSNVTGNILALGKLEKQDGQAEQGTVRVTQRFD